MTGKKDISAVIGISIRKALEFKNISLTTEESELFTQQLFEDKEFIEACKNVVKFK